MDGNISVIEISENSFHIEDIVDHLGQEENPVAEVELPNEYIYHETDSQIKGNSRNGEYDNVEILPNNGPAEVDSQVDDKSREQTSIVSNSSHYWSALNVFWVLIASVSLLRECLY